jgi:DNA-binding XRE family transcriptional regulator
MFYCTYKEGIMKVNTQQVEHICTECKKNRVIEYPNNVSALRERAGFKRGDAANRLGISRSYYSLIENGKKDLSRVSAGLLFRMAELFGVSPKDLVDGDIAA